jgi:hypothetical protein
MIEYDDFVVQIAPAAGGEYAVTVSRSPAGKGGLAKLPESLVALTLGGEAVAAARGIAAPAGVALPKPAEPRDIGGRLFNALFSSGVGALFLQSYGTSTSQGRRLRIRLQLNVDDESVRRVAALPWELLYHEARDTFLVRSADVTVVRELDVAISGYPIQDINGPLRVLFVMANPRGDLQLTAERSAIEQQLAEDLRAGDNRRQLVPEFLENATFAALEDLLRKEDYHIIHFMGHGDLDARGEGHLLFHDGPRSGRDLGDLLKREKNTRLVTLNACQTAAGSATAGAHPFAGVAQALVKAGVPAVIAMQVPVSDKAAIAFSARLYSEIGRGSPIEEAVDSGRMRLHALAGDGEWATPVLLIRDVVPFPVMSITGPAATASAAVAPAAPSVEDVWGPKNADTFRVFLAAPIMKLTSLNKEISSRLQAIGGVRTVTQPPPSASADPDSALDQFRTEVRRTIGGADLSVHLLGDSPGESFNDDPLCTYPIEQLKIAIDAGLPVMAVIQKAAIDNILLPPYRNYVTSLKEHYSNDNAERFEQATVEVKSMIADEVAAKVQRLRAARQSAPAATDSGATDFNAYIDVLKTEAGLASKLVEVLNALGDISRVTQAKSDGMRPPAEMEKEFAKVLGENQLYVVLQGEPDPPSPSPSHWASYRWRIAQKSAANSDSFNGVVAVYRPKPAPGVNALEIKLNNLPENERSRKALKALIEGLS